MSKVGSFLSSAGGGAILSGAAGLLGSIGSGRKAYHRSKKLMDKRFQMDKQMWDYQNAYNTPSQQMARMKKAGLNPALMYGQGNTGNASQMPSTQFQELTPHMNAQGFSQSIGAGISLSLANSQKKAIETKTALDAIKTVAESSDYKLRRETFEKYSLPFLQNTIRETDQNIKESQSRIGLNEVTSILKDEQINLIGFQKQEVMAKVQNTSMDTMLKQKMIQMDYSELTGKNWMVNAEKLFGGQYNLKTYAGAAGTLLSLAVFKNPLLLTRSKSLGKLAPKAQALYAKMKNYIKNKFK